jgi:drug/metabolite transporter (DMT)-like permease
VSNIILALYVISATCALLVLKLGTAAGLPISYSENQLHFNINAYIIFGFILYGLSFLTYMYLVATNDLGYIIPLAASFVYILLFIGSFFLFKEVFTLGKILGIVFILVGIVVLSVNK